MAAYITVGFASSLSSLPAVSVAWLSVLEFPFRHLLVSLHPVAHLIQYHSTSPVAMTPRLPGLTIYKGHAGVAARKTRRWLIFLPFFSSSSTPPSSLLPPPSNPPLSLLPHPLTPRPPSPPPSPQVETVLPPPFSPPLPPNPSLNPPFFLPPFLPSSLPFLSLSFLFPFLLSNHLSPPSFPS